MSGIHYNLAHGALLRGMAPPALAGGSFGAAALPAALSGAGIYLIVNNGTNNRYVGISTELDRRFKPRLETVTELGFSTTQMGQICVYWGTISIQNTPAPGAAAPAWVAIPGYGAPLQVPVDGVNVQLEKLLIRFVLTQFVGGTVSNNSMATTPIANGTGHNATVKLTWGAGGLYTAGTHQAVWASGASW